MKLPELHKRKPKTPSGSSSSGFQPPAFLQDLFKDMRDRRLIIPAVALLIAIFAVPVLLSSPSDRAVQVAAPAADPGAVAVKPAVLAVQETGVRDFQERLDELKRKDPFGDRFAPEAPEAVGDLLEPEEVLSDSPGGVVEPEPSVAEPSGGDTSAGPAPAEAPGPLEQPEAFVLVPRVDVEVGVVDRSRRQTINGVKSGEVLPSKEAPAAMFLGNSDGAQSSEFLVSRDVSKVNGEGDCKPSKENCEFLTLRDGESAYLRFADGNRYVITVKDIYFVRVDEDEFRAGD